LNVTNNNDDYHKRSKNVSFRLNKDILAKLKTDAERKQISLNTLVNQIFDFYVNFTSSASADLMPAPKVALTDLVEGYSEDQLKAHAERVYNKVGLDIVYQLRGKYDFESVLDVWDYRLKASGIPYKHTIDGQDNNRHTFIIQYSMGKKWSLVVAETIKRYFEPVSSKKVEYTITDNMVAITVEGKD
jgi:HicB-like protein involved in pilus formation